MLGVIDDKKLKTKRKMNMIRKKMTKVIEKIIKEACDKTQLDRKDSVSVMTSTLIYMLKGVWPLPIETVHEIVYEVLKDYNEENYNPNQISNHSQRKFMEDPLEENSNHNQRKSIEKNNHPKMKSTNQNKPIETQLYERIIQTKPVSLTTKNDEFGPSIGVDRNIPAQDHNTILTAILIFFAIFIVLYLIAVWD